MPNTSAYLGVKVNFQAFPVDSINSPMGFTASNGVEIKVGAK